MTIVAAEPGWQMAVLINDGRPAFEYTPIVAWAVYEGAQVDEFRTVPVTCAYFNSGLPYGDAEWCVRSPDGKYRFMGGRFVFDDEDEAMAYALDMQKCVQELNDAGLFDLADHRTAHRIDDPTR